jgi:hypothetical protein
MHACHNSSAVRAHAPGPLNEMPQEIWTQLVVSHISLSEGRTITSLACVSRLFAQWMKSHIRPVALYRALENASKSEPATALHRCMSTLYDLGEVNPAYRLELFLRVSTTLGRHFRGQASDAHIDTLLASMEHLPQADQPAALLGLVWDHGSAPLCTTQPRYLKMASRIGTLQPSAAQVSLTETLARHISDGDDEDYARRTQLFLDICMRLQPVHHAQVVSHVLHLIDGYPQVMFYSSHGKPVDQEKQQHNKKVLLWGLHQCLQSMPIKALPLDQQILLLGRAAVMPAMLADADEANRMAVGLLQMTQTEGDNSYWLHTPQNGRDLDHCMEDMLEKVFEHGVQQSLHRFQRLYQAMAHLPPSIQVRWMRSIIIRCARYANPGVTPALIVATAQAARQFTRDQLDRLYDLFAVCLTPGPLRGVESYSLLQPAKINSPEQSAYMHRFKVNCGQLMHNLRDTTADVACKLLAGINGAYERNHPLDDILPSSSQFTVELYGHFLKQALDFLQSVPLANAADCLLQWRMPRRYGLDARSGDDQVVSLLMALHKACNDSGLVSQEQQKTALSALMEDAVSVIDHSPVRNRHLFAALSAFSDSVYADVLCHLLETRHMGLAHTDVLFSSVVEAAGTLPEALQTKVLKTAAYQLGHFPEYRPIFPHSPATLHEQREAEFEQNHPGLQASNAELHAYIQPGCVTCLEGFGQLLDAMNRLPPRYQADVLRILCNADNFFRFSNGRLSKEEALTCSMRLLSSIISLPNEMMAIRTKGFLDWLNHFRLAFQGRLHALAENRLLAILFALPAKEGEPMFNAYLAKITYAPEKAALQEQARLNWKTD